MEINSLNENLAEKKENGHAGVARCPSSCSMGVGAQFPEAEQRQDVPFPCGDQELLPPAVRLPQSPLTY